MYSPSRKGTTACVEFPGKASTKSTALAKVPVPSVFVECLT